MTLDQIRIFLAVAAEGHMTRAARGLNMTQSAVSAAIATLEAQSGIRLFDRVGRGIELTAEGAAFVGPAQAVLTQAETARIVLGDLARETRGTLRIHASQTVATYWLPPRLVQLHRSHPGIDIRLETGNTTQVARSVLEGRADLGFVEGEVDEGLLLTQVVARDELVLVLARGNPLANPGLLAAADYRAMTWVLREEGSGTRSEFEAHLATMGLTVEALDVAFEMPTNEAVLAAVSASHYVTMLSRRAVAFWPRVRTRRVVWAPSPLRPFSLLSHPERHRTRAMLALISQLSGSGTTGTVD